MWHRRRIRLDGRLKNSSALSSIRGAEKRAGGKPRRYNVHRIFAISAAFAALNLAAQSPPKFDSVEIGVFDPQTWNGIVFVARARQQPLNFALRFGSRSEGFLDGEQIYNAVSEVGPHAPDGSYCRVSWKNLQRQAPVTLEWSRIDETTVVGRLAAAQDFQLVLETYFTDPLQGGSQGFYSIDSSMQAVTGERFFDGVFDAAPQLVVMVDQPAISGGLYPSLRELRDNMNGSGRLTSPIDAGSEAATAGLEFVTGPAGSAHFVAALGWSRNDLTARAHSLLEAGRIDAILKQKSEGYATRRPRVAGLFEGAEEAIGNSMFWNTLYAPSNGLIFPSISRRWANNFGGWVVGEWDCFFGSLLTGLEDQAQTAAAIKAILLAQGANGVVPNIAGGSGTTPDRSQPPVGSFAVWKEYQKFQDRDTLAWAYPRLVKWHDWWFHDRGDGQPWRDGNHDGLLEWGSDRGSTPSIGGRGSLQQAKWESGMDDSPMWDDAAYDTKTYTMNLDDVGLNSLYALDAECLAKIAMALGNKEDSERFSAEYDRIKHLVRERLWNDADGIYENRFWDGRFSKRLSPTNFYPLFAGIATTHQAERMVKEHLLNPEEFWGPYVAPTIARNDPAFKDQFYWRGDIWGPTNYMLYEGIDRYQFDQAALDYAQKNYALFMDDWKQNQHDNEQYHSWAGNGGGDTHYTWGALLCLVALDQYIDENPWDGLRFGALDPPQEGTFSGRGLGEPPLRSHHRSSSHGACTRRPGSVRGRCRCGGAEVRGYPRTPLFQHRHNPSRESHHG
ncbi:MAG TPA: trehalase family glycosidase [Terriglobia bacterium]|nr:trehalase family glycosidase [Terriglobia bacterium]